MADISVNFIWTCIAINLMLTVVFQINPIILSACDCVTRPKASADKIHRARAMVHRLVDGDRFLHSHHPRGTWPLWLGPAD